ncbi:MAG TPA: hypothetical protein VFS87_01290, partial [Qipengyuania sp.]|nr:hypothetical protein [Qipengyuania sp.]
MAEILPFRRTQRWTRARDYGVPARRRGRRGRGGDRGGGGGWLTAARESGPILWAAPLALGVAVFLATSPEMRGGLAAAVPIAGAGDRESASFGTCSGGASRQACVVDGDTF